ncbi:MAG: hypothetical protein OEW37_08765 [Rhodospirillaceae bacterium]|nr:hypothetical protein [Rhodospirillaceae bacterium]
MDNQHKKIKGYRDLTQEEIDLMNEGKELAETVGVYLEKLARLESTDKRWLAIAKTDMQTGFMAAVRSVAKPTTF